MRLSQRPANKNPPFLGLLRSIRVIVGVYSSPGWIAAFELMAQRRLIKIAWRSYLLFENTPIGTLMLVTYGMLSSVVTNRYPNLNKDSAVAMCCFSNELKAIDRFRSLIEPVDIEVIVPGIPSFLNVIFALKTSIFSFRKIFRSLQKRKKKQHFFVLCQLSSGLFCWAVYNAWFKRQKPLMVAVSTTSWSQALTIIEAAKSFRIPTVHCSHGHFSNVENQAVPQADLVLLDNQISADALRAQRSDAADVILWGMPGGSHRMRMPLTTSAVSCVGLYPSFSHVPQAVAARVNSLRRCFPRAEIILRLHPVEQLAPVADIPGVPRDVYTLDRSSDPLGAIQKCDLAIVGNTSLMIRALKQGTPCLYDKDLDRGYEDTLGTVKNGVVPPINENGNICEQLTFFDSIEWQEHFRRYDPSYQIDPVEYQQNIRRQFFDWFNKKTWHD